MPAPISQESSYGATKTPIQRIRSRLDSLERERQSWIDHWRQLSEYILPRRSRFLQEKPNLGSKRNDKIINGTPIRAVRTLASGMMSGISSPARPWFKLGTPDPGLNESSKVRTWTHTVETRMAQVFSMSNIYNALPNIYADLGVYGTACCIIDEDEEDVIRAYVLPIGQYSLANSKRLSVDTLYQRFWMTAQQMEEAFGKEALSSHVKLLLERGQVDEWVEVARCIEPNRERAQNRIDRTGMAFTSNWFEVNASDDASTPQEFEEPGGPFLRRSGYREFPALAVRWDVTGEDVYGHSPGMDALGDCKSLQLYERRKAQGIDKMINPPMVAPASLRNTRTSQLPGDVTYLDAVGPGQTYQPVMMMPPQAVAYLGVEAKECAVRINELFYADLWLMLAMDDRQQPATAREIAERHEEKLLQLGPVLERLHDELLDPLIDRTFNIMYRRGMIPEPPEELWGAPLKVEYISVMAQAQKMVGIAADERFAAMVGQIATFNPRVLDKVNWDKFIEGYAERSAVNPDIVVDQTVVDKVRAERDAAAKQQAQIAMIGEAAQTAKALGQTPMGENENALEHVVNKGQELRQ